MNKWLYILGILLIAGFAVLGVIEMQKSVTPYVTTIGGARAVKDRPVQFKGSLIPEQTSFDSKTQELQFVLADDNGKAVAVSYDGVKPANFESVDTVVVTGNYRDGVFHASEVMTKCPSKYEKR